MDENFYDNIRNTLAVVLRIRQEPKFTSDTEIEVQETTVGHGSGFVCEYQGKSFVITAAHVVGDKKPGEFLKAVVKNKAGSWVGEKSVPVLTVDKSRDLAVLSLNVSPDACCPAGFPEPAHDISSRLRVGVDVYYYGFPYVPEEGKYVPVVQKGMIAGFDERTDGKDRYVLQGLANPGNSGGPVFTPDSKVIGIVVEYVPPLQRARLAIIDQFNQIIQVIDKPSGLSLVVPINYAIAMLKNAVALEVPDSTIPASGTDASKVSAVKISPE